MAIGTGKKARSTTTWLWLTAAGDWMAPSMSCQMSLQATVTTTPTPATTPCHSAPRTPHPLTRFQAHSLPACRPLSGQVGPTGMITTPPCLPTGSTAGSPLQGLWTGGAAAWTEATAIATTMAQAHSIIKGSSLKRSSGPAWLPLAVRTPMPPSGTCPACQGAPGRAATWR